MVVVKVRIVPKKLDINDHTLHKRRALGLPFSHFTMFYFVIAQFTVPTAVPPLVSYFLIYTETLLQIVKIVVVQ